MKTSEIQPIVIIDSREQLPYSFDFPSVKAALPVGDYSLQGLESVFAIERKSLSDLIGCLTHDRARFLREIERGSNLKTLYLLIEASLADIEAGKYRSKINPESVIGSLLAWVARFRNFKPIFAGNRNSAQKLAGKILRREGLEAVNSNEQEPEF
ncbi:MAG: ERCC4 domain-containing protein [Candidatus Riflebacteria bacterium]|nr:ERCC4 domain-containing protein [Candidatus Riflebacteria bacterium]